MKCYTLIILCNISLALFAKDQKLAYQPFDSLNALWMKGINETGNITIQKQWPHETYTIADENKSLIKESVEKGDYLACYKVYKKQLEYYEQRKDSLSIANTYVAIGTMYNTFRETEKALACLQKAQHIYRNIGKSSHFIKNQLNIANSLYMAGRQEDAERILNRIIANTVTRQDTLFHLNVLASLCSYARRFEQKEKYSREAFSLAQNYGKEYAVIISSVNMGAMFHEKKEPDSALYYYRKVWNYLQNHSDNKMLLLTLNGMANCFQQKKQWDSAYIYMNIAYLQYDSLQQLNNLSEIDRIESRTSIERYEESLKQQKEDARTQHIILILILGFIVVLASASCYTFWSQRKKALIKKRIQELESQELSTRLENEQLQNDYYRLEIDSRNRELTSNTLILIEKNRILEELTKRINSGGENGEISGKTVTALKNQIRVHTGQEDEWQFFRVHFEQVHPDFFNKLKEIYSTLTEGELRLCAYIRTGMENKQIAQMLSQQPDTIKKARYRLRKKLPIGQDDSLEDFLRSI